jgi:hypothetical protein
MLRSLALPPVFQHKLLAWHATSLPKQTTLRKVLQAPAPEPCLRSIEALLLLSGELNHRMNPLTNPTGS